MQELDDYDDFYGEEGEEEEYYGEEGEEEGGSEKDP